MVRKKGRFWEYVEVLDKGFRCTFCKRKFSGGIPRIKPHLAGIKGCGIDICEKVPEDVRATALLEIGGPCKKSKTGTSSNNLEANQSSSTSFNNLCNGFNQSVIMPKIREDNKRMEVDEKLTKFILSNNLPLDVVETQSFADFVSSVAQLGPDYKLPSTLTLKSKLVPDLELEVEKYFKNVKESWVKTGCTIMVHKLGPFYSFVASSPKGSVFINLWRYLDFDSYGVLYRVSSAIEYIGADHVVQLICKNEETFKDFEDLIISKYPRICMIPCVAHKVHILLFYIFYDVSWVKDTIYAARIIVDYMFDDRTVLLLMRKYMNDRELKRPSVTKFSYYQMLQSVFDNKEQLTQLVSSAEWGALECNYNNARAIRVADMIQGKDFWSAVEEVLKSLEPIIQVFRLVEDDRATSGYLYEAMEMAEEALLKLYYSNKNKYGIVLEIFKEEEEDIIHPIHAAAAFLNPAYMCRKNFKEDPKMKEGISYVLKTFVADEEKNQFMKEIQLYRNKISWLFTEIAMGMLEISHPWAWWDYYGDYLPVLRKYAIRILSQPCKCSCELKYSAFDVTQSKEIRGAAFHMQLELVCRTMNTMMMEKFKAMEARSLDRIDLRECNELPDYVDLLAEEFSLLRNDEEYCAAESGLQKSKSASERRRRRNAISFDKRVRIL